MNILLDYVFTCNNVSRTIYIICRVSSKTAYLLLFCLHDTCRIKCLYFCLYDNLNDKCRVNSVLYLSHLSLYTTNKNIVLDFFCSLPKINFITTKSSIFYCYILRLCSLERSPINAIIISNFFQIHYTYSICTV